MIPSRMIESQIYSHQKIISDLYSSDSIDLRKLSRFSAQTFKYKRQCFKSLKTTSLEDWIYSGPHLIGYRVTSQTSLHK